LLRHEISQLLHWNFAPELDFRMDRSWNYGQRIDYLLSQLNKAGNQEPDTTESLAPNEDGNQEPKEDDDNL
jgi:hypothetical protein